MTDFLTIVLYFLDVDRDNIFSGKDKVILLENSELVPNLHCLDNNSNTYKPCGYVGEDLDSKFEVSQNSDNTHFFNSDIFESWFKPGRILYIQKFDSENWLFVNDEAKLDKDKTIYSLSNSDKYIFKSIEKKLLVIITIIAVIFASWFILLPKKVNNGY